MNHMKRGILLIVIALIFLLVLSAGIETKGKIVKVNSKVYDELEKNDKVRVIVTLEDGASLDDYGDNEEGVLMEHEFETIDAFSGALTQKGLEKLRADSRIKKIEYDLPVHIFLQNSTRIINATDAWNIQVNGENITGKGFSVCIVDTGINYSHNDFGHCNPVLYNFSGDIENYTFESEHNYSVNMTYNWTINMTGFHNIGIHFKNISTEGHFDFVKIYDSNDKMIASYHGQHQNVWTPSAAGDTIKVELYSDTGVVDYGFYADQLINGSVNVSYDWSNCSKVLGGYDVFNSDGNPMDDNGHGTHVSGIAAANGNIKGVAPGAGIVSVKAFGSGGDTTLSDVMIGMEYCLTNKEKYNVSAISMSFGTPYPYVYNSSCDNEFTPMTEVVNEAVAQGILVVASTGNDARTTEIALPACIENVTSVAATNKDDTIWSFSNRNNITDLMAPGVSINSTILTGGYAAYDGTSQAAPHVSGAAALLYQYLRAKGSSLSPQYVQEMLQLTGKIIHDSANGLDFSRINVYAAIMGLDENLSVKLISPANGSNKTTSNVIFVYNVTDAFSNISNCSLYINDTLKQTNNTVEEGVNQNFTELLSNGYYRWQVKCYGSSLINSDEWFVRVHYSTGGGGGHAAPIIIPPATNESNETGQNEINLGDLYGNSNGFSGNFSENDTIKFKVKGKEHRCQVKKINSKSVLLWIFSDPIVVALNISETKLIDLDGNGLEELAITLNRITNNKAELLFKEIEEQAKTSENLSKGAIEITVKQEKMNYWPLFLVLMIIVLFTAVIYYVLRDKKLRTLGYK